MTSDTIANSEMTSDTIANYEITSATTTSEMTSPPDKGNPIAVVHPSVHKEDADDISDIISEYVSDSSYISSEDVPDSEHSDFSSHFESDDDLSDIFPVIVEQSSSRPGRSPDEVRERSNDGEKLHSQHKESPPAVEDENTMTRKRKLLFQNISVETYESREGKRNYAISSYCTYCQGLYKSKMSKHLMAIHASEAEIREITALPIGSPDRKMKLQKLANKGNYNHNLEVLKKGHGALVVYRRPIKSTKLCASEYLPCEYCLGFFHQNQLWLHVKSCYFRNVSVDSQKNYVRNGRIMLAPFLTRDENEYHRLDVIIDKMKETSQNPGLKAICMEDQLIREFGLSLIDRCGIEEEQRRKDEDNLRTKMRTVARLLKKLNEKNLFNNTLSFYICPKEFSNVVASVKELFRESDSPQLAVTLGSYVKQVSLLKASLGLQQEDTRMKKEANDFQEMFNAHWNSKVSAVANRTKRLRTMNTNQQIPSTDDLVKLKEYLVKEIQTGLRNSKPVYDEYVHMTQLIIARIVLFNKRRIGEVEELKVTDFKRRLKGTDTGSNSEIINSLGISERALLKRMELVEVRGKSTRGLRKVFVLLTQDMVAGIGHLLVTRIYAGVNPNNVYIFGRTSTSPQDGCAAMRMVTEACPGLGDKTLIRTRLLRKYLATTTQIMDMSPDELKLVADHMGHSVAIHTNIYKLQSSVLERTKVARALVALENGKLADFHGRPLNSICLEELPDPVQKLAEDEEDEEDEWATLAEEAEGAMGEVERATDEADQTLPGPELEPEPVQEKPSTSRGIKRKRWSPDEEKDFCVAFGHQIEQKKNVSTAEIRAAQKKFRSLQERSEAVIRSKMNNIILGKIKK